VGEANVIELMQEKESEIGGEGNGGVIVKDLHLGRDSLVATLMILNKLSKSSNSISSISESLPKYSMIKNKISIPKVNLDLLYRFLIAKYPKAEYDQRDGLKIIWDSQWIHVRNSNTEPIIRIIAESETSDTTISLIDKTIHNINSFLIED
jgi:phosphomannomutase